MMLTHTELVALARSLRSERVLSVYIDPAVEDPAVRRTWRVQLDHSLKDLRATLADAPRDEREEFERCVTLLREQLPTVAGSGGTGGWVAFITAGGVRHAERLPVPTPTLAVWSTGIWVAPYVRAFKQARPVIVVLADARKASIYRYVGGQLELVETVRARATLKQPTHMGSAPRSGFHPGVRGATGRDDAQRVLTQGTNRMLEDVAGRVLRLAGPDGWIVSGGIPRVAEHVAALLARSAPGRVLRPDTLDIHASDAAIEAAAREGASALRNASDLHRIEEAIELGAGSGPAVLGPIATRRGLAQSRVRELYITHRYLSDHAVEAESAVRAALDQDALVEEVSGKAAQRLDEHGGVAARLRFRLADARDTTVVRETDRAERAEMGKMG
jgi:hypothetical protein